MLINVSYLTAFEGRIAPGKYFEWNLVTEEIKTIEHDI
jgi:hypothetical protein